MTEAALTFVDTNILAYAYDDRELERGPIARALVADLWEQRSGALSTQVLQEFYSVVTRNFPRPISRRDARGLLADYARWHLVQIDVTSILAACELEEQEGLSFWDALIFEAARTSGATRLVSEDFQHGRRIAGIRIENPFR